ncbi:MAG: hypothetical protein KAV82_03320 [Phycisphaerae bacterium]|nr:hypothetical protein [Phycisphaerae bacterium]
MVYWTARKGKDGGGTPGDALASLAELDERAASVVELRYFAGFTWAETAEILGVSSTTVRNDWDSARTWLYAELADHKHG